MSTYSPPTTRTPWIWTALRNRALPVKAHQTRKKRTTERTEARVRETKFLKRILTLLSQLPFPFLTSIRTFCPKDREFQDFILIPWLIQRSNVSSPCPASVFRVRFRKLWRMRKRWSCHRQETTTQTMKSWLITLSAQWTSDQWVQHSCKIQESPKLGWLGSRRLRTQCCKSLLFPNLQEQSWSTRHLRWRHFQLLSKLNWTTEE